MISRPAERVRVSDVNISRKLKTSTGIRARTMDFSLSLRTNNRRVANVASLRAAGNKRGSHLDSSAVVPGPARTGTNNLARSGVKLSKSRQLHAGKHRAVRFGADKARTTRAVKAPLAPKPKQAVARPFKLAKQMLALRTSKNLNVPQYRQPSLAESFTAIRDRLNKAFAYVSGVVPTPKTFADPGEYLAWRGHQTRQSCLDLVEVLQLRGAARLAASAKADRVAREARAASINEAYRAHRARNLYLQRQRCPLASRNAWQVSVQRRPRRRGIVVRKNIPGVHSPDFSVAVPAPTPAAQAANRGFLAAFISSLRGMSITREVTRLATSVGAIANHPVAQRDKPSRALRLWYFRHSAKAFAAVSAVRFAIDELRATMPRLSASDNSQSAMSEYLLLAQPFINSAKVLAAQAASHNKLMHALNGNIDGLVEKPYTQQDHSAAQAVAGEFATAARPELGGAIPVLTEFLFGALAPSGVAVASVNTFDKVMLQRPIRYGSVIDDGRDTTEAAGTLESRNRYHLDYPEGSGRLPTERFDQTKFTVLRNELKNGPSPVIPIHVAPYRRQTDVSGPTYLKDNYAEMRVLWEYTDDYEMIAKAEKAMSSHRFAGTRGNRTVLGWESQAANRINYFRNLAAVDAEGSSYFRMMYYLWSDYMVACVADASTDVNFPALAQESMVTAAEMAYDAAGPTVASRVRLEVIGARTAPPAAAGVAGVSGESWLSDPNLGPDRIADLASGKLAFLDIEGMDDRSVSLAIKALCKRDRRTAWSHPVIHRRHGMFQVISPLSLSDEFTDAESGGVLTVVLHCGASPLLTQVQAEERFLGRKAGPNPADSPWNVRPNRSQIAQVIRHFIMKHFAANDAWAALDAVLYSTIAYEPRNSPVAAPNAPRGNFLTPFGNEASSSRVLPPDLTLGAYFDRFRHQMSMEQHAPDVLRFMQATATESVWTACFMSHAAAVSLNWAAYAFSMRQEEWRTVANPNAAGVSQYRRNLAVQMTSRLLDTEITPWSTSVVSAMAVMYEFKPMFSTLMTMSQVVAPVFAANTAPYLANAYHEMWMLKKIPQHMLFPWTGAVPSWPEGPAPMFSVEASPTPRIRLARALKLFTGRAWVQDGAMQANAQFYAACPGARNTFRSDSLGARPAPPIALGSWASPYQYEWPANANQFQPIWMAPAGNPFANFLVPGTLQNYDSANNRIRACGVRMTDRSDYTCDAFGKLTLMRQQGNVAIKYIPPVHFHVEYPPVNDFSMLVWTSTETGAYSGMTMHAGSDISALERPQAGGSSGRFPVALANHNNPHAPGSDGELAQRGYVRPTAHKSLKFTPKGKIMTALKARKAHPNPPEGTGAEYAAKNPLNMAEAVERLASEISLSKPRLKPTTDERHVMSGALPEPTEDAPEYTYKATRRGGRSSQGMRKAVTKRLLADPELTSLRERAKQTKSEADQEALETAWTAKYAAVDAMLSDLDTVTAPKLAPPTLAKPAQSILDPPVWLRKDGTPITEPPSSSGSDTSFFLGTSTADQPAKKPGLLKKPTVSFDLTPVRPEENNDSAAPLAQTALIPPAPKLNDEGEGNGHFPSSDGHVFEDTKAALDLERSLN